MKWQLALVVASALLCTVAYAAEEVIYIFFIYYIPDKFIKQINFIGH